MGTNELELTFEVHQDTSSESPRDWDNLGTMICCHGRYTFGDEQFDADDFDDWNDLRKHLIENREAKVILPLYVYDHSGLSMYTDGDKGYRQHEAWDSGQVGFIYATEKDIEQNFLTVADGIEERAEEVLKSEIETYSQYIEGDVWGVEVFNKRGKLIDSLWGLFGQESVEGFIEETKNTYEPPRDSSNAPSAKELHCG